MEKSVRILLLEDQESDAILAKREIKKIITNYELEWVDNRDDFTKALKTFDPNIIISDFRLPTFDGLSALKIRQQLKPEIPFIMFTGSINEDTAVDCMKAGASDYIIKEHLKRLGPAILSALEQKTIREAKQKAEIDLVRSEERYHRMAENIPDMIYRINTAPTRSFEYINKACVSITGYTVDEFYNNPLLGERAIHPDDLKILDEKIKSGQYFFKPLLTRLIRKDGKIIWFEQRNIPIYDENGNLIAIEGIAQDVTEKKNAEMLKQVIFEIAQAANSVISLKDLYLEVHRIIKTIMSANNFYIALYDENQDLISFPYFIDEIDPQPEPRKPKRGFTEYVLTSGKPLLCDSICTENLKSQGLVEQIGQPHSIWLGVPLNIDGKTIGVMTVQHYSDPNAYGEKEKEMLEYVSSQVAKVIIYKKAEEQILKLSQAVQQSPVSIVITNINCNIEYVNQAFETVTGYMFEEVIGKNPRILQSGKTPKELYPVMWNTILSGKAWKGELINKKKNGELFVESANITPIMDEKGKIIYFLGVKEDITQKKRNEEELVKAKEKAEESDKLKTAFLQNMSHEIRTPMNAIMGFAELMELETDDPEKLHYYSKIIKQRSNDLLDIINELLDIARIESGQVNLRNEPVELNALLDQLQPVYEEYKVQINKAHLRLIKKEVPKYVNTTIQSDSGKLKQILVNLIHNALKFTNEGQIEYGFHSVTNDNIVFYVSDTGIGIPENMRSIIFERFRKSADESVYVQDGIGLGLAIVKGLIQIFGGKIWLESELGSGSIFYFSIPYTPVKPQVAVEKTVDVNTFNWSKHTILIVEDDSYNTALFTELLHSTKVNFLLANNGETAISIFNSDPKISLVLMDIKLPDISGFDLTVEFKKSKPQIPIIAQTAYAAEADRKRAIEVGCTDFISKPIKREQLLVTLSKYLNKN